MYRQSSISVAIGLSVYIENNANREPVESEIELLNIEILDLIY
jgi:hypothetical protein